MIHVTDIYTTFARLAGATGGIPRDRVIDGLDQTGVLLLGETHGRRDYVHIYEEHALRSVVEEQVQDARRATRDERDLHLPDLDLYRDPRELRPGDTIKYSPAIAARSAR